MSAHKDDHSPGAKDPLHGVTLEAIVTTLVERYGWDELGQLDRHPLLSTRAQCVVEFEVPAPNSVGQKKVEDLYLFGPKTR